MSPLTRQNHFQLCLISIYFYWI